MSNLSLLPERIKKCRNLKGWKQKHLAEESGVKAIASIEAGNSKPSVESLVKIADALEVSVDHLLGRAQYTKEYNVTTDSDEDPEKQKLLENISELKDLTIKRLEREVVTYRTHIERQDKMIELLQGRMEKEY